MGCVALLAGHVNAQDRAHFNTAELRRESVSTVAVTLYLNWPQALHQLLAPQLTFRVFLETYLKLPELQLEKEMTKAKSYMTANAFFSLPSGARANLRKWQLPANQSLRESFKLSLMLLDMPANAPTHLDPVKISAEVQSKGPLTQVQIQLPKALYPIWVNLKNDKFWLTEQIPLALISF